MTARITMSRRDRAALADAIRDMRRTGIKPRELIQATGVRPIEVYDITRRGARK